MEKVQFGSKEILFKLEYSNRKTLCITVNPDLSVLVKAPLDASPEKIREKVKKRAPWILKQQSFFLSFEPRTPPRRYVSGETHLYLGRQYRLKVVVDRSKQVKLKGGFLAIHTPDKNHRQAIKAQLYAWYLEHARQKFTQYAQPWIEVFKKYHVEPERLEIKHLRKRWGSCSPNGKIVLNVELIKAPKGCIEYVLVHELCHLMYPNHSKAFFELQARVMPDWERWKERLEKFLA